MRAANSAASASQAASKPSAMRSSCPPQKGLDALRKRTPLIAWHRELAPGVGGPHRFDEPVAVVALTALPALDGGAADEHATPVADAQGNARGNTKLLWHYTRPAVANKLICRVSVLAALAEFGDFGLSGRPK